MGGWVRGLIALLCAAWFGAFSLGVSASTPDGMLCPTAHAQIRVAVTSCCGKVVGYTVRAPRKGEAGFVQCRCNEKRSAGQQASSPQKPNFYLPCEASEMDPISALPPVRVAFAYSPPAGVSNTDVFFHPPRAI
jgi:hypothetical protein